MELCAGITPEAEGRIREIVSEREMAKWSKWTDWPKNWCAHASSDLRTLLQDDSSLPRVARVSGLFNMVHHFWLEALDATIVDPTGGQFTGGEALVIVRPGEPLYGAYHRTWTAAQAAPYVNPRKALTRVAR